jgi:hypothetical protein
MQGGGKKQTTKKANGAASKPKPKPKPKTDKKTKNKK